MTGSEFIKKYVLREGGYNYWGERAAEAFDFAATQMISRAPIGIREVLDKVYTKIRDSQHR